MKRSLLALAALTAFAGAASAQSSVTLFGIVDQSVNYVKNGDKKTTSMQSNQLNSNRLGFRGVEDLGGGLKGGFWLEAPMTNENGNAGGLTFVRRSTVSLFTTVGEIRLGRDYDPSFWNLVYDDVDGANGIGQGLNIVSLLGSPAVTLARANNSVGYFLPGGLGGFYGQLMVAAGQGNDANKYYGGRFGWASGPIDVNLAYGQTKTGDIAGDDTEVANVGGSYDFGVAKVYFFWNNVKYGGAKQDVYDLSVGVPIGPGQLRGVIASAKAKGTNPLGVSYEGQKADLYSLEYVYDLSKRTALYTSYAYLKNKGGAAFSVLPGTIGSSAASNASLINGKSEGFNVGLRHSF